MDDLIGLGVEIYIEHLYDVCMNRMYNSWDTYAGTFNHGQLTIYEQNLVFALEEFAISAAVDWPWTDVGIYEDCLFSAYDGEVLERAFSDSIRDPMGDMAEIIQQAQDAEDAALFF